MAYASQQLVNAVKKLVRDAAPDDPLPEAVSDALSPFAPESEPSPSVWAKRQYFAALRYIAIMESPPGALHDHDFYSQTKNCVFQLGVLFPGGDYSFPTTDHYTNVELCLQVYNMGKKLCALAGQRLGLMHLRKMQYEATMKSDINGNHEETSSEGNDSDVLEGSVEVKQEEPNDMPVLDPQESVFQTYNDFTFEIDPKTKALHLVVNTTPNLAYKYKMTDELNLYACTACSAQAYIDNLTVRTAPHTCDAIEYSAQRPSSLDPCDAVQLAGVFATGSRSFTNFSGGPYPKRRRLHRELSVEFPSFFFGLSMHYNPTKLYVQSPDSPDHHYEYSYRCTNKSWACDGCRRHGLNTSAKLVHDTIIGHPHHPECAAINSVAIECTQEARRIIAKLTSEQVQALGFQRLVNDI